MEHLAPYAGPCCPAPWAVFVRQTKENQKFKYFVKGGEGDKMQKVKREQIFIGLLEGVHPEDAKVVLSMINKKTLKGITRPVVEEAFPNLLKD